MVLSALLLVGLAAALPTESLSPKRALNTLTIGMQWDYPLGYPDNFEASDANASVPFYSVDLENTDPSDIATLKNANHFVACYFSAGTWEMYREDQGQFPNGTKGKYLKGYDDERWLDTRNSTVRQIMTNRITTAQQNGCQGIDADNIDGYENDTGFNLTIPDGVDYVRFLASTAHSKGMKFGLKNGGTIVPQVLNVSDWEINEECVAYSKPSKGYNECNLFKPFIDSNKPVFHVEYTNSTSPSDNDKAWNCNSVGVKGFSTIIKHISLDSYRYGCT